VRIVSWNLAGRVKRLDEQAKRLLALEADHLCLQEVTPNTLIQWELLLGDAGYDTIQHGEPDPSTERSRPLMVLSTSRGASARVAVADAPWPERMSAAASLDAKGLSSTSPEDGSIRGAQLSCSSTA
jgi:hypothetical protein